MPYVSRVLVYCISYNSHTTMYAWKHTVFHTHPRLTHQERILWISPYKFRDPTITSITDLFRSNQVMFNNVNTTNVVTNISDEEQTFPPGFYTMAEIIAMLNTMTVTVLSIFTKATDIRETWIWKDKQPFYLLCSMDRMWFISLEIVK